jgi:hypothetical protein
VFFKVIDTTLSNCWPVTVVSPIETVCLKVPSVLDFFLYQLTMTGRKSLLPDLGHERCSDVDNCTMDCSEPSVFSSAVKKLKNWNIQDYNFACGSVWV